MRRMIVPCLLILLLAASCEPAREEPSPEDAAAYFGIFDGLELVYRSDTGLEETHTFERSNAFAHRVVYDRLVKRGGFSQDDAILSLEATLEGLQIVRFYDCLNRCGVPDAPVAFLPWPIQGGERLESEVTVEVTRNGEPEETRAERHRLQLANQPESVEVAAGSFEGFEVIWQRTIDESTDTALFVVAPEVGIIVSEGFDGVRFELSEAP